jgi:hypothetical protein
MINPGWLGEYYLQQDFEGHRKLLKRLVGSLHLEPATRQRIRHFDMERIQDRRKLDPDLWKTVGPDYPFADLTPREIIYGDDLMHSDAI